MEGEERQPERASLVPGRISRPRADGTGPAHNWRVAFAAIWLGVQLTLIATASQRVDGAFGFRMFNESSTLVIALYREVDGERVHVEGGVWTARARGGEIQRFSWFDRVRYWVFDVEIHASYGASAQLARLQAALDDVAAHIPEDAETARLVLEVTVRRNGREPIVHRLLSRERITMTREEAR